MLFQTGLCCCFFFLVIGSCLAFHPVVTSTHSHTSTTRKASLLDGFFTGGWNDGVEAEAGKIASTIKSVKDLGWTKPPLRPGSIRPRHRAFGGQGESPIQDKANYDASNPQCVETWLTQDFLNAKYKCEGPVGDTLFVTIAGGAAFAERDVCEKKIAMWKGETNKFNSEAFLKTVNQGRTDLAVGWGVFFFVTGTAALGILFPTNPSMKLFEGLVAQAQGGYVGSSL